MNDKERVQIISKEDHLTKGDRVRFVFSAGGLFAATKRLLLLQRLKTIKEIKIENLDYTDTEMKVTALVVENPLPVVFLVGSIVGIAGGMLIFLSLVRVEKIISSPAGAALAGGFSTLAFGIGAVLLLGALSTRRKFT